MKITLDRQLPANNAVAEIEALAQALHEITILQRALEDLIPVELRQLVADYAVSFTFDRTKGGRLRSVTATARPEALDS